jgi:hypothetical protein
LPLRERFPQSAARRTGSLAAESSGFARHLPSRLSRLVASVFSWLHVDHLCGLKENVTMGRLIPAGAGFEWYRNVRIPGTACPAVAAKEGRRKPPPPPVSPQPTEEDLDLDRETEYAFDVESLSRRSREAAKAEADGRESSDGRRRVGRPFKGAISWLPPSGGRNKPRRY